MSGHAFVTPDNQLAYCEIPKVGCTYWKKIIRVLSRDFEGDVTSPDDINRMYVHFGDWNHTKIVKLNSPENLKFVNEREYKFLMTRDPYSRLWSGYLDKLFLLDFWWWLGTKIAKETRQNTSDRSLRCGHDVTFQEFVLYVVTSLKQGRQIDHHFSPIHKQCDPCRVNFNAVGKVETFSSDVNLILNEAGLDQFNTHARKGDRLLDEIRMLTEYNFDIQETLIKRGSRSECYNQSEIAQRIWRTFQFNGYIGDKFEFPAKKVESLKSRDEVRDFLLERLMHIRKHGSDGDIKRWGKQRKLYLAKAFKNLPNELKTAITDMFASDFELFGYEAKPEYIFTKH